MNKSTPPLEVLVRNEFLFNLEKGYGEYTKGTMVSVRSLPNQALQFSVLLETGALFTGLPVWALCTSPSEVLPPISGQMWDNISGSIDVFVIEQLRLMPCYVLLDPCPRVSKEGFYLFSIDFVGANDLSAHPEHWKQLHIIGTKEGQLVCYPQYRIQFLDKALCQKAHIESLPAYKANSNTWAVE